MLAIGQLASYAGVTIRAVRHYHEIGLLREPERDASGYRSHDAPAVVRLIRIRTLAEAGVPLARVNRGHRWNRKAVARLVRLAGIEGAHRRRRGKPRRKAATMATAPDLVRRQFTATAPNRLWVADISYLRTWEGFLYLAVVVDAYSRRVVGWAMADHLRTELILDAVGMAIQHQRPARDQVIHHSDRGTQYTSFEFGRTLRSCGILASLGSVADCYDNAMAETFFAALKTELIYTRAWPSRHELEMEVFSYIEGFYNPRRRHSRLG
jgi:transposase InsO family protein